VASGAQIGNSVAVQNYAWASGDDDLRALVREWRRAVPEAVDASDDSAALAIAAVRELASLFSALDEGAGKHGTTAPGGREVLSVAIDLIRRPAGLARYQALAMLAGAVLWFSRESGRPEAEVLDEMAGALDNLEGPLQAVPDEAGPRERVRTRRLAPGGVRATGDSRAKVIAAVRELLSCVPVPGGGASQDTTAPGGPGALPAVTDLVQDSAWLARYLPLAMLAAVVMRLSRDSGRPEAEVLDGLAASFRLGA